MSPKRIGKNVILLNNRPGIIGNAAVVGKKEGEGPLSQEFDKIFEDEFLGKEMTELCNKMGFSNIDIYKDFRDKERFLLYMGDSNYVYITLSKISKLLLL